MRSRKGGMTGCAWGPEEANITKCPLQKWSQKVDPCSLLTDFLVLAKEELEWNLILCPVILM